MKLKFLLFIFSIFFLSDPFLSAESDEPSPEQPYMRKLGLGAVYTGFQVRAGFLKSWSAEMRYLLAQAETESRTVKSSVVSGRIYKHFRINRPIQLYAGGDFSYGWANGSASSGSAYSGDLKASGYAAGGFGGIEYYILRRLSIGLDIGPYYIDMKEKTTGERDRGLDFVFNTFINVYFF